MASIHVHVAHVSHSAQMIDIAHPNLEVEVQYINGTLWVNVDGLCRLRVCQIDPLTLRVSIPKEVL